MPTYFGYTAIGADAPTGGTLWTRNKNHVTGYTCPGSGPQVVKELSAYVKSNGGTPGHIRIAVYDASHNLICQGTAEVTIDNTTAGWYGHLTQANITPNPAYLTGGVQYDLALCLDAEDVVRYRDLGTLGDNTWEAVDYTDGWPSTLADVTDGSSKWSVRCGVDPANLINVYDGIGALEALD